MLKQWLRKWLGIDDDKASNETFNMATQCHINTMDNRLNKRIAELDNLTRMDADVGCRGECTIILTGVYQGKAYVQYYDVDTYQFKGLVEQMRYENKQHLIRTVDAPRGFKGWFNL